MSNREIKERLTAARIDHSSAIERDDLILMMMRLVERELFNKTRANQPPSFSRNDPQAQNVQINNGTFFFFTSCSSLHDAVDSHGGFAHQLIQRIICCLINTALGN